MALPLGLLIGGCSPPDKPGGAHAAPTYYEDVAPLLVNHCANCHRAGGIAPFALTSYADAAKFAGAIKLATLDRSMPPFNLDNSGACNTYVEARWLSDDEIALFGAWASAGAPAGDAKKARDLTPPPASGLGRVDRTLAMSTPYTPNASKEDDYRCFVIDPGLEEDKFITGFEIHPGAPQMVHHLTLFALDSEEDERAAEALDAADAEPGYACFGDTIVKARWLAGSGPGGGAILLPEGTGLRMTAGRKTVLQMHYNRRNGVAPDRTTIDLELEPSVPSEANVERIADLHLFLPPHRSAVTQEKTLTLPSPGTVWGLWPHMHTLGTKLEVTAIHDGKEECLARVNRWEFHWQGFADYTKPIHLSGGDQVRLSCTYNTMSRDKPTVWGSATDDEMCVAFFYVTPDE